MTDDLVENWLTQVRKGVLDLCVLNAIRGEEVYGYEIVKRLRALDGLVISEGTIYPLLSRLKRDELVETFLQESPEGPARKYYRLTDRGRERLSAMNERWDGIAGSLNDLRRDETNEDEDDD